MEPLDREGNNQAFINLEGDNTFKPIRIGHWGHVIKTNIMADFSMSNKLFWKSRTNGH